MLSLLKSKIKAGLSYNYLLRDKQVTTSKSMLGYQGGIGFNLNSRLETNLGFEYYQLKRETNNLNLINILLGVKLVL